MGACVTWINMICCRDKIIIFCLYQSLSINWNISNDILQLLWYKQRTFAWICHDRKRIYIHIWNISQVDVNALSKCILASVVISQTCGWCSRYFYTKVPCVTLNNSSPKLQLSSSIQLMDLVIHSTHEQSPQSINVKLWYLSGMY